MFVNFRYRISDLLLLMFDPFWLSFFFYLLMFRLEHNIFSVCVYLRFSCQNSFCSGHNRRRRLMKERMWFLLIYVWKGKNHDETTTKNNNSNNNNNNNNCEPEFKWNNFDQKYFPNWSEKNCALNLCSKNLTLLANYAKKLNGLEEQQFNHFLAWNHFLTKSKACSL